MSTEESPLGTRPAGPVAESQTLEEYDYTAQQLLQAPSASQNEAAGRRTTRINKTIGGLSRSKILLAVLLSFALSYGLVGALPRRQTGSSGLLALMQHLLSYSRNNIFFALVLLASLSGIGTAVLLLLGRLGRQQGVAPIAAIGVQYRSSYRSNSGNNSGSRTEAAKSSAALPDEQSAAGPKSQQYADIERRDGQFYHSLQFLLQRKQHHLLQGGLAALLMLGLAAAGLFCAWTLRPLASILGLFVAPFGWFLVLSVLLLAVMFFILLRNQYRQGLETLYQIWLQQIYQYSSPTNPYNQLNAVNLLYALAFVEARQFRARVAVEFQHILQLTRSSWYQKKYSRAPAILVEEVLRKFLSAVDFHRLFFAPGATAKQSVGRRILQRGREYLLYVLFLKDFQNLPTFRYHATVSLLRRERPAAPLVLQNYYLVGANLANLCIKEAQFHNCQLSLSNWSHSQLSDCSLLSCHLDQAVLHRSQWRRLLWQGNTARELVLESCLLLQGNIEHCNLQGLQGRADSRLQHCLLRTCDLSSAAFCPELWQGVTASDCQWREASIVFQGQLYAPLHQLEQGDLPNMLRQHLQIKER